MTTWKREKNGCFSAENIVSSGSCKRSAAGSERQNKGPAETFSQNFFKGRMGETECWGNGFPHHENHTVQGEGELPGKAVSRRPRPTLTQGQDIAIMPWSRSKVVMTSSINCTIEIYDIIGHWSVSFDPHLLANVPLLEETT